MKLPDWIKGVDQKDSSDLNSITIYLDSSTKYSKPPYLTAIIKVAEAFPQIKIIISDSFKSAVRGFLSDNNIEITDIAKFEQLSTSKNFYAKNSKYFESLIQKIEKDKSEDNYIRSLEECQNLDSFLRAKEVINKICEYEQQQLRIKPGKNKQNKSSSFSLSEAIELTVRKRVNHLFDNKILKYDPNSKIIIQIKNNIIDLLAQFLSEVLEVKNRQKNSAEDEKFSHAILVADRMSPAMYNLLELVKLTSKFELSLEISYLLTPYRVPEDLFTLMNIQWNAQELDNLLFNPEKEEGLIHQLVFSQKPRPERQKLSYELSFERLLSSSSHAGLVVANAFNIPTVKEKLGLIAYFSASFINQFLYRIFFPQKTKFDIGQKSNLTKDANKWHTFFKQSESTGRINPFYDLSFEELISISSYAGLEAANIFNIPTLEEKRNLIGYFSASFINHFTHPESLDDTLNDVFLDEDHSKPNGNEANYEETAAMEGSSLKIKK